MQGSEVDMRSTGEEPVGGAAWVAGEYVASCGWQCSRQIHGMRMQEIGLTVGQLAWDMGTRIGVRGSGWWLAGAEDGVGSDVWMMAAGLVISNVCVHVFIPIQMGTLRGVEDLGGMWMPVVQCRVRTVVIPETAKESGLA